MRKYPVRCSAFAALALLFVVVAVGVITGSSITSGILKRPGNEVHQHDQQVALPTEDQPYGTIGGAITGPCDQAAIPEEDLEPSGQLHKLTQDGSDRTSVFQQPAPEQTVSPKQTPEATQSIPVLLYHHMVAQKAGLNPNNGAVISVEEFEAQMNYLSRNRFTTPSLSQFVGWLNGKVDLPPRSILITFDDGYRSTYEYAYPILKKVGLKATVFVVGALVGKKIPIEHLDWSDIIAMKKSGVIDVQNHTYDGHGGTSASPCFASWSEAQVEKDLSSLDSLFIEKGLNKSTAFSYPFGARSEPAAKVLRRLGYSVAFTTREGISSKETDPFNIPRIIVWPGTDQQQFAKRISTQHK